MAAYDARKLAARSAGRPAVYEFSSATGANQNTNVAVTDRKGQNIQAEDMLMNVFDTSTSPWTDDVAQYSVTSPGNIQNTVDNDNVAHTLLVIWLKRRPGLG